MLLTRLPWHMRVTTQTTPSPAVLIPATLYSATGGKSGKEGIWCSDMADGVALGSLPWME